MSPNNHSLTDKAGIIATVYGPRDKIQPLTNLLGAALGLVIQAFSDQQYLSNPDEGQFLRYFDPPAAYDTRVVLLALSAPGEASRAWETLHQKLKDDVVELLDQFAEKKAIWGYNLIYHAALVEGATLDEQARDQLLRLARRPDLEPSKRAEWLAHTNVAGADLWLMDIPNKGEGSQAATVYVALSPMERENDMITKILYGPGAALLMPDLIAHKSYYQTRQYTGKRSRRYKERVRNLREKMQPLLGLPAPDSTAQPVGQEKHKQLETLSQAYARLLIVTSFFDELRISLAQQLENYTWWEHELGSGNLAPYHKQQIRTVYREVDLLIEMGQRMQEAARTTIEMVQAKLEQAREQRENEIAALIAILGIALAVSQLVDASVANALLDWFSNSSGLSPESSQRLKGLSVQFIITALLTWLLYWCYQKWR